MYVYFSILYTHARRDFTAVVACSRRYVKGIRMLLGEPRTFKFECSMDCCTLLVACRWAEVVIGEGGRSVNEWLYILFFLEDAMSVFYGTDIVWSLTLVFVVSVRFHYGETSLF